MGSEDHLGGCYSAVMETAEVRKTHGIIWEVEEVGASKAWSKLDKEDEGGGMKQSRFLA